MHIELSKEETAVNPQTLWFYGRKGKTSNIIYKFGEADQSGRILNEDEKQFLITSKLEG